MHSEHTGVYKPAPDCSVASGGEGVDENLPADGLEHAAEAASAVGTVRADSTLRRGWCYEILYLIKVTLSNLASL